MSGIIEILATDESPYILFNPEEGLLRIEGKSLPENTTEFYGPLDNAVRKYVQEPHSKTSIQMKMNYLNSSSTKKVLEIVTHFEALLKKGYPVEFIWYCYENDEDMYDEGAEFERLTDLKVTIIQIPYEFY